MFLRDFTQGSDNAFSLFSAIITSPKRKKQDWLLSVKELWPFLSQGILKVYYVDFKNTLKIACWDAIFQIALTLTILFKLGNRHSGPLHLIINQGRELNAMKDYVFSDKNTLASAPGNHTFSRKITAWEASS